MTLISENNGRAVLDSPQPSQNRAGGNQRLGARFSIGARQHNLATKTMSNGVEVIVAGESRALRINFTIELDTNTFYN